MTWGSKRMKIRKKTKEQKKSAHLLAVEHEKNREKIKKRDRKIKAKGKRDRVAQYNRRESQRISTMNRLDDFEDAGKTVINRIRIINESISLGGKRP